MRINQLVPIHRTGIYDLSRLLFHGSRLSTILKKIMIFSLLINMIGTFGFGYLAYKNRSSIRKYYIRYIKDVSDEGQRSPWWIEHYREEGRKFFASNENLTDKPIVMFVGDSLTNKFPWNEWLAGETDAVVVNRSSNGEKLDGMIGRFESIFVHRAHTKKLFIMIGINDIRAKGFQFDLFINRYQLFLQKLLSIIEPDKVYITSILPTRRLKINLLIQDVNKSLKSFAHTQGMNYLDLYGGFIDDIGLLDRKLTYDGLHLTIEGYNIWLAAIKACISIHHTNHQFPQVPLTRSLQRNLTGQEVAFYGH